MEGTWTWKGWIGYGTGPGGKDYLPPDVRAEVERRGAERTERQGRLLCEVHVEVYEHDAVPGVAFPAGSAPDVESDSGEVASAIARARDALAEWR
jgi:hypothetical protein